MGREERDEWEGARGRRGRVEGDGDREEGHNREEKNGNKWRGEREGVSEEEDSKEGERRGERSRGE